VVDTIKRENLLAHVGDVGSYFYDQLNALKSAHDCVESVRGAGLMLGLEMKSADVAKQAHEAMLAQRIILNRTHETVLRFLPPFLITRAHVDTTIAALNEILTRFSSAALAGSAPAGEHSHGQ
jgi:acetylornithine aminotransferase/acetylornithine/N-succinyldiaminopimelate aminotransferase